MGRTKELHMQMAEEQSLCIESIMNEFTYEDGIRHLRSSKVLGLTRDTDGYPIVIHGENPKDVYEIAKKLNITDDLDVVIPYKHYF
jgi:hypothetical protein